MLKLINIKKIYNSESTLSLGLDNTNLEFSNCEFVAITGRSGSGKSTLMNIISGLDVYSEGEMEFLGEKTSYYDQTDFEKYTNENVGFILQQYNLIETLSVKESVRQSLIFSGYKGDKSSRIEELLDKVGLSEKINKKIVTLSGGEKQRLVIAKAFAKESRIIVADEPTANLDKENGEIVIELLNELSKSTLVFIVTHNYEEVSSHITRNIELRDGKVVQDTRLNTQNELCNPKEVNKSKAVNILDNITMSLNLMKSNISRLSLQLVMILMLMLVLTFYFTLTFTGSSSNLDYDKVYGFSYIQNRLAVSSPDNDYLTIEQVEEISNIANTTMIVNDSFLYTWYQLGTFQTIYINDSSYVQSYDSTYPDQMLNESNIKDGKVEGSKIIGKSSNLKGNEIISSTHEKEDIGSILTLRVNMNGYYFHTDVEIVGVYSSVAYDWNEFSSFIASDELIEEISNNTPLSNIDTITYGGDSYRYGWLDWNDNVSGSNYNFLRDSSLTGKEIILSNRILTDICYSEGVIDDYRAYYLTEEDVTDCSTYLSDPDTISTISTSLTYTQEVSGILEEDYTVVFDPTLFTYDSLNNYDIRVSTEVHETMSLYNNSQVSLIIDDMSQVDAIKQELVDSGYYVLDVHHYLSLTMTKTPITTVIILTAIKIIPIVIIASAFAFFMILVFKRKTQELVLIRSVGASRKDLSKIQYFEYLCISLVSIIAISLIFRYLYSKYVFEYNLVFIDYVYVFLIGLLALLIVVKILVAKVYKNPVYSQLKRNN